MNRVFTVCIILLLGWTHALGQATNAATPVPAESGGVTLIANDETDKGVATANRIKGLIRDHRMDDALAAAQAEIQVHPEYAATWYSVGDVYLAMHRYQDAIPPLQKCLAIDPKASPALFDLGICQQAMKQYDASITSLSQVVELAPGFELAWRALYGAYGGKNDIPGAEKAFRAYTEKFPQEPNAWYTLGQVQMYEQLPDEAIVSWEKTVQLKPDFFNAVRNLGLAYSHTQQYDKAIGMLARAAALKPDAEIVNDLGYAYLLMGQNDRAIETLKQSLVIDPKYEKALYNLTDAYSRQKQWALAWQTAHALAQIDPQSAAGLTKNFPPENTVALQAPPIDNTPAPANAVADVTPEPATNPAPSSPGVLNVAPLPSQSSLPALATNSAAATPPAATTSTVTPDATPAPTPASVVTPPAPTLALTPSPAPLIPTAPLATAAPSTSTPPSYSIAAPPAWVQSIDVDSVPAPASEDADGGVDYILNDNQEQVDPQSTFYHYAMRLTNEQGLEVGSDIRAEFDPNYQTLAINWLRVKRDGVWSDRLRNDSFQLIRREENLDSQMLDGRYSAICHLQDVRAGDIVDFAYTVTGANPIFGGKFVSALVTGFLRPVRLFNTQVIIPAGRDISVKGFGGAPDPTRTTQPDGSQLLTWRQQNVPATTAEPGAPPYYDSLPWVELTEFKSWNDVARWGYSVFSLDEPLSSDLQQEVDDIKNTHSLPETRAVAAINFVQNEVRYLGIEMGPNSYKPTPATQVLARRFGDCKDKAQLCVVMLRALGIHCAPALVSTTRGEASMDLLPSPLDFDHAIVALDIDSHLYWVDVTRPGQTGQLRDLAIDDFKRALPVAQDSTALARVTVSPASLPQITVDQTYQVNSATDPATLLIHATYKGSAAEAMRDSLSAMTREELQKDYLQYYGRIYPQIKVNDALRFQDSPDDNSCEVWQSYTVPNLWSRDSTAVPYRAEFVPFSILGVVGYTIPMPRTAPFRINYPADVTVNMEIDLFDKWPMEAFPSHIETPNFSFTLWPTVQDNSLHFQYHYQSTAPDVMPTGISEYNDAVERVREQLEYHLVYTPGVSPDGIGISRPNWKMVQLLGAIAAGTSALGLGLCFIRRTQDDDDYYYGQSEYEGIGGWLVVVIIMIALGLLSYGRIAFGDIYTMVDLDRWELLTHPGSARYDPYWAPLLLFEGITALVMFILLLTALVLMMLKRFTFPYIMIVTLCMTIVLNLVEFSMRDKITELMEFSSYTIGTYPVVMVTIRGALWITYFIVSKRVKATFRT